MFDKMKALMDMQRKMQELKHELNSTNFEIKSPDGLVKIVMSGAQEVRELSIQGDLKQIEKVNLEKAARDAVNTAIKRAQDIAADKMKAITGLNLPGL